MQPGPLLSSQRISVIYYIRLVREGCAYREGAAARPVVQEEECRALAHVQHVAVPQPVVTTTVLHIRVHPALLYSRVIKQELAQCEIVEQKR